MDTEVGLSHGWHHLAFSCSSCRTGSAHRGARESVPIWSRSGPRHCETLMSLRRVSRLRSLLFLPAWTNLREYLCARRPIQGMTSHGSAGLGRLATEGVMKWFANTFMALTRAKKKPARPERGGRGMGSKRVRTRLNRWDIPRHSPIRGRRHVWFLS
jgi:hypothetical protein